MNKPRVSTQYSIRVDDNLGNRGNLGTREAAVAAETDARSRLAQEEAAIENKIVDWILDGEWQSLRPNSGISVEVRGSHVCVDYHEESGYRVWEWHGHCMMYEEGEGYCPEYIYGNYFEPLIEEEEYEEYDYGPLALNSTAMNRGTPLGLGLGGLISGIERRGSVRNQYTGDFRRGR
ncbi:hypothetical protein MPTK1_4g00860 [Marchantia polymorpha subsp. ruderalis]|uniref:Uncharacterized protein n=2 Tax=Marchantia polymorpha TaxID=3197 RepID=A0AAF6B500_MARPO|nr:hypothetical protein MARPO_0066s0057 [Marchantia polymorpha]BBN07084.1 hypothetical protein Mp_4g00860 [Marchantia polymorpha subsp. ruderalis]|eukprot:PTQ36100.1 hypothetical protein MARPO_0066s0057 [Marchantia polymorpha]